MIFLPATSHEMLTFVFMPIMLGGAWADVLSVSYARMKAPETVFILRANCSASCRMPIDVHVPDYFRGAAWYMD